MTGAGNFLAKTGVLGSVLVGEVSLLALLEDGELVCHVGVWAEESSKVKMGNSRSLRFWFKVGASAV